LYTKLENKISRVGDNESSMKLGCDCVVAFVIEVMIEKKEGQANQKH
jgi:hypothetical protein